MDGRKLDADSRKFLIFLLVIAIMIIAMALVGSTVNNKAAAPLASASQYTSVQTTTITNSSNSSLITTSIVPQGSTVYLQNNSMVIETSFPVNLSDITTLRQAAESKSLPTVVALVYHEKNGALTENSLTFFFIGLISNASAYRMTVIQNTTLDNEYGYNLTYNATPVGTVLAIGFRPNSVFSAIYKGRYR